MLVVNIAKNAWTSNTVQTDQHVVDSRMLRILWKMFPLPMESKTGIGQTIFGTESTVMREVGLESIIITERLQVLAPGKLQELLHPETVLDVSFILIRGVANISNVILKVVEGVELTATFVASG